jgi:1-deoxy-D-xylulose-5-phosphate reductoisomerase
VLNAANEIAVAAFLEEQIRFDQIHAVNQATLEALHFGAPASLPELLDLDLRARAHAQQLAKGLAR